LKGEHPTDVRFDNFVHLKKGKGRIGKKLRIKREMEEPTAKQKR